MCQGCSNYTLMGMLILWKGQNKYSDQVLVLCLVRKEALLKMINKLEKQEKLPQGCRHYALLLTEGIYFTDSMLVVPGRTCLIMDEWLRGIEPFSGTKYIISIVSISRRWPFPGYETLRPTQVIGSGRGFHFHTFLFTESSRWSKMVVTRVEFHYHFYI